MVDVGFIIDSSGSISSSNWNRLKRFLMSLTSKLNVSNSQTHVGAVTFATSTNIEFDFRLFGDTDVVNGRLTRMPHHRGYTYTDLAIKLASEKLFSYSHGMRVHAAKVRSFV